jgi:phosphatidate cytidylyltransferase
MTPMDDLDPPTFRFGPRDRGESEAQEDTSEGELEIPRFPDQQEEGPEITVSVPGDEEPKPPLWRRLPFAKSETGARVVIAIPWILFAIFIVAVGGAVFMLALIGLGVLGLREFFRMTAASRPVEVPAYLALAGMVIAAHYGSSFQILLVIAASFPVMFFAVARRRSHENVTISIAITVLAILWLGIGLSHAVLLRDLPLHGGALLIDVLIATFIGDTAAYGAGRLFGSRKITPRISPNKTLEGLIGGFIGGTMGFWFAGLYQDWLSGADALVMGMVVASLAPIGDLFASLIKRDLEVKDTGSLFGPHGGLIDRLDAVLFTVVAGYYLSVAFVY